MHNVSSVPVFTGPPDELEKKTFFYEATQRLCSSLEPQAAMRAFFDYVCQYIPLKTFLLHSTDFVKDELILVAVVSPDSIRCPFDHLAYSSDQRRKRADWKLDVPDTITDKLIEDANDPFYAYANTFHVTELSLPYLFLRLARDGRILGSANFMPAHPVSAWQKELLVGLNAPLSMTLSNLLRYHELDTIRKNVLRDNRRLRNSLHGLEKVEIIGAGRGMAPVMQIVRQAAPVDIPVLITGETGVGKDLVAHAIHEMSARRDKSFVAVNCGALPPTLIDSELFGHVKGAFTGAATEQRGFFEQAEGGTLFLDELGELPLETQARFLRILETGMLHKVGGQRDVRLNIRIIAATNQDVEALAEQGRFRRDMLYRLNAVRIHVPPLRERREDIPMLVQFLIDRGATRYGMLPPPLPTEEMEKLLTYDWPGNVRELQNVLEAALVCSGDGPLRIRLSPASGAAPRASVVPGAGGETASLPLLQERDLTATARACVPTASEWLRRYFEELLTLTNGRIGGPRGAAALAGMNVSTFRFQCKKTGIALGVRKT